MGLIYRAGNFISEESQKIAAEMFEQIKKQFPKNKITQFGLEFANTKEERKVLHRAAEKYNEKFIRNPLMAHGVQDIYAFSQIMLDSELKHGLGGIQYGNLAVPSYFYDYGWGIFVLSFSKLNFFARSPKYRIPLDSLESIVLPSEVVPIVKRYYPAHENKLVGYIEFAKKISEKI